MSTQHTPSSKQVPQTIIPVRPATGATTAPKAAISAGLLRRTLGGKLASRRRPASHSDTAGPVSAAPTRLGRIARIALAVVVPVASAAVLVGTAGSASAATNWLGAIQATVTCSTYTDQQTAQVSVAPSAQENPSYPKGYQWVAYSYAYRDNSGTWHQSGWSSPTKVDAIYWITGADGEPTQITGWTPLPVAWLSYARGAGRIAPIYVEGAYWDGAGYEYGPWIQATYRTVVNGYSNGQSESTVPCSV
jgi:hypothetical protein